MNAVLGPYVIVWLGAAWANILGDVMLAVGILYSFVPYLAPHLLFW